MTAARTCAGMEASRRLLMGAVTAALVAALALTCANVARANPLEGEAGFCREEFGGAYADSACTLPASGGESRFEWVPAAGQSIIGKETTRNTTIESDAVAGEVVCKSTSGGLEFSGTTGLTDALRFGRCFEERESGCGEGAGIHGGAIDPSFTGSLEANAAHEVLFDIPSFTLEFECLPSKTSFFIDADPTSFAIGHTNTPIAATAAFRQIFLTASAHEAEGASFAVFEPGLEYKSSFEFRTAAPAVTGLSPAGGSPAGGTSVTLTGLNFTEVESVSFGATPALEYNVDSPTQITATAPAGHGQVNVIVTTAAGTSAVGSANRFSYAPVVEGLSPADGPRAGGTTVLITGQKLDEVTGVTFGGKPVAWELVSPEAIRAVSPPSGAAGNVAVQVEAASGTSAVTPATSFDYLELPQVTKLSPKKGPTSGGTTVLVTGEWFEDVKQVTFGGVPASSFKVTSRKTLEAVSPPNVAENVNVTVTGGGGTSAISKKAVFKYGKPEIARISPASGPLAGGTVVTIEGAGFTPGTSFLFKKAPGTSVSCESTSVCTATSPAALRPGTVSILAVVGKAKSAKSPAGAFTYE